MVTATATTVSGSTGAAIGSGVGGRAHSITISDAVVIAGSSTGAGIGSGAEGPANGVSISKSFVIAQSMRGGAGIGSGYEGSCGDINIEDSVVFADSQAYKTTQALVDALEKIGSAKIPALTDQENKGKLELKISYAQAGINVFAAMIYFCSPDRSGAAIGSGREGNLDSINITRSYVHATTHNFSAGIGSGEEGDFGTISITDSEIESESGKFGAAIGSGMEAEHCGTINITKSTVTATAGLDAAGIGTGSCAEQSATINITGSTVTSHAGEYGGAGIGGGGDVSGGTIKISGSTVKAYGGEDAAGIGGGEWGDGGHIEINNSNVYAEGKGYGAGIGGGEDSSGEYCSIVGNSTVEAVSGGEGNVQSIGHGDCGWYVPKYSGGALYLDPTLKLNAGSSSGSTSVYTGKARYESVWKNKYAKLYPCSHTQTEWRSRSATMHAVFCTECQAELEPMEYHEWDSEFTCTVCGAKCEPATLSLVERNNSGEITLTQSAASYSLITVPECTNTPDGYRFVCWKDSNDHRYLPGFSKDIRAGVTLTAVYLPVETTKYIDKNGDEQTVEACIIPDGYQYYLSDGWYVVKDNISTDATINVNGAVNIIVADGKTFTYTYARQLFSILAYANDTVLSIYGQKEQTGTIDLKNGGLYSYYVNQYGARILSADRGNIGAYYSVNIFSGDVNVGSFLSSETTGIYGGNVVTTNRSAYKKLEIGWTNLHDSYTLNDIRYNSISIADGQAFTDGEKIYKGNLSATEIETISGKTLAPYLEHDYAAPEWEWDNEYRNATAVFRCKDCDEVQEIRAKVTYTDSGKYRTSTARCTFLGQEYTTTQTKQVIFDVTIANTAHGTVTANKATARAEEYIDLNTTPDEGYILSKLYYTDAQGNKTAIDGNGFTMPASDVTVTAEFTKAVPAAEPYIDADGAYHLGNVEHFEIGGKYYAVNEDGSVGDELNEVAISYFDFELLSDNTYQIKCYTGPMDNLSQLEIPKTFNGKAITVLGDEEQSFMKGTGTQRAFSLVLNENVTTIKGLAFFWSMLTEVKGDTSGLNQIKDTPFVWANISDENKLTLKLDYPGRITVDSNALNYENITARIKHATTLSSDGKASSIEYIFTDAHIYGEPVWTWADDYSSATAKFTCTDSRCKHEETVSATVTSAESEDNTIYIATAEFDGETYTDVKGSYYIRILGSEHGTVTADKTYADEGETVTLTATPDDKYMLKSITVKDADNNAVTVTNSSFIMPAGGVTVSAVFGIRTANISVGGVGINVNNCSDILGDGTASYDFDTNTLTLTNANIEVKNGNGIRYNEKSGMPFNIVLNGENRIADDTDDGSRTCYGIALYAAAPGFKISGSGTLSIEMSSENPRVGIHARKALTVETARVNIDVTGSENAIGVDLVYSDSVLKLDNTARVEINAGGYAMQSNRNVKNLNVGDDCYFEAISDAQAFNGNINLTDDHPTVIVNTEPSADGSENWDGSTALTSYKYINMRGEDAPYWVAIIQPEHGTVTADKLSANEGESVTLTARPDDGYILNAYSVKDANGETVAVTDNSFVMPASDVTVTATFTKNKFTVTWKNGDTVLETDEHVPYGATPTYDGETPVKAGTAQYTYTFTGWSPEISEVTGDVTYTAQFSSTVKKYTVIFKNYDGTVLQSNELEFGITPAYTGDTPEKAATAQYTYTFDGWDTEPEPVRGDTTYTAVFTETVNKYTVTWKNGDTVLETDENVPYGTIPTYDGETPTKASENNHGYIFKGWSPEISSVTGSATYTAQFNEADYVEKAEPYIDENGAYITGCKAHFESDGKLYAVNADGSVGEEVTAESLVLSYFDFTDRSDGTLCAANYTGPTDGLTELVIPKTYNGKNITEIGSSSEQFIGATTQVVNIVLNENIKSIAAYAFYERRVRITGDTSALNSIGDFAFAKLSGGFRLEINLNYPGTVSVGDYGFGHLAEVYIFLKHETTISNNGRAQEIIYTITDDAHTYGDPTWTWADDYKSATATFTCTDSRCGHKETVNATVTKSEETSKTVYTATAEFENETYTNTVEVNKALSTVTIADAANGTVTADKSEAYVGEEVTLTITPDSGYKLATISVKDDSNNELSVTDGKFTMPASNVTVTAVFAANNYTITYNTDGHGVVSGVHSANVGNEIKLSITPNGGYELDTLSVKDSQNRKIDVTGDKFTMPADNVTVEATFKKVNYTITYEESEHGTVSGAASAQFNDLVQLTITPDEGYILNDLNVEDEWGESPAIIGNAFYMPADDVTVTADFLEIIPEKKPWFDSEGEYHLGNVRYVDVYGTPFSIDENGRIGSELDSTELSYFDFKLINSDSAYQINYYTGPTDALSELVIPKTFNGKPVTVLGNDINDAGNSKCRLVPQGTPAFTLVLNENITEIKPYSFYSVQITKVEGDTSSLSKIGNYAFSWANSGQGYALDIKLDHIGKITTGASIFNHMNVTARIRHATTFNKSNFSQQSINYVFTDAHTYGSPVWTWADDYSSATAKFTCTDSRCKHEKTVNATVSTTEEISKTVYTATAENEGRIYTDTQEVAKPLYSVTVAESEYGAVTSDKSSAYAGEEVTLTVAPDEGCDLVSLTVKDESNGEITVNGNKFIMPVGKVTVTAVFTVRKYTVTWKNGDTVLENDENVPYGTAPTYDGETPAKAATAQYTYTFNGWSPELSKVTGDVTYTAVFTETVNRYTVKWKNGDTVIETDENVPYGTTPTYDGETPTKAGTAQHSYTFTGWSPEISEVTGDITYTALFDEAVNKYTVTWENGDTVLETDEDVPYGTIPTYDGEAPTKASDDENLAYIFSGWSPEISVATGDVTYTAQFAQATRIAETQPYIDENGAYILGLKAHYETDSKFYSVNNDGTIGEEVTEESLKLSYFDFALINNGTEYQINYYTGPTENLTKLEIPKTYNGKNITVLGNNNKDRLYEGTKTQFELVLNENIREIKGYTFYVLYVTKVSGDTSGLSIIGDYAFSWANSPSGYTLDIKLDHPGRITAGYSIFNNMKVTARIKHATTFSKSSFGQQSISYLFTDAHTYGEPEWTWADDYSSATAKFTCTDSHCKHEETVDATVTSETKNGIITYTATVEFDGKTCTDTKTAYSDGVGARLLGHSISLDGDIAVNFYMELAPEIAQSKTAYMQFTIPNTSAEYQDQKVYVKDLTPVEGGYYIFKCRVAAKDMTSTITAQILGTDKESTVYTYSVKEYADWLLEHKNDSAAYTKAAPLVEKMLQYGAYAKEYFEKTDTLDALGDVEIDERFADYTSDLSDDLFSGATLSLKSQTSLSLYFTSEDDLTFSCVDKDGNERVVDTAKNGSYQVARIRNIAAKELQDNFTLTVKSGETVLGTITYSPMNYCYNAMFKSTDAKLINAVKALVQYSQEANEYFK